MEVVTTTAGEIDGQAVVAVDIDQGHITVVVVAAGEEAIAAHRPVNMTIVDKIDGEAAAVVVVVAATG